MLGIIYRTWVLARQDEIEYDLEDLRVAETPSFDAEDDAEIPAETSEFPLTMLGGDGSSLSDHGPAADAHGTAATITAGSREIPAADAAAEEQPGSRNLNPGPEGGVK
jgi:multicomponent Na+:H+ antiporter subunit C